MGTTYRPKKRSRRRVARLSRDGITTRLSDSFKFFGHTGNTRSKKRSHDPNQLGKLIADIGNAEVEDHAQSEEQRKDPAAEKRGGFGGLK
jgi:hypothetical protein